MIDRLQLFPRLTLVCAGILAVTLAACGGGGGGGGGGTTPPAPAPSATAVVVIPSPSPSPSPTPGIAAVASIGGSIVSGAAVVFSCGCTGQAGTTTADANGNYAISSTSTATPAAPTPTYTTVPGRNYLSVITAPTGAQAWDIAFLGAIPAHNHTLNTTNASDAYTTAAALYIFANSISATKADAFDTWDFTTIAAWVTTLQSAPNAAESKLLTDITAAQAAHTSLYPSNGAAWAPAGTVPNVTIKTDLDAVSAAGSATRLPQQCLPAGQPCAVPTP